MKKTIKNMGMILLLVILPLISRAQWYTVGNALSGGEWLGASTAFPINFKTNNIQQMTILGSGNVGFVGIGKSFTSPASLLSVDGTLNPTGEVFRTNCPSGTTTIWRMIRAGNEYGSFFSGVDSNFYKKKTILRSFC